MRELEYFIEVSDGVLQKLLEEFREKRQQKKDDPGSGDPPEA